MNQTNWNSQFHINSPIFDPVASCAEMLCAHTDWPTYQDLNTLRNRIGCEIVNNNNQLIVFVPHEKSKITDSFEQQYEPRIYLNGEVSTREKNWHDFFNALVWMIFPKTKAALNQIHYQVLMHSNSSQLHTRGSLRDAATLFDESGVVVLSSESELITMLRQHEWKTVFWKKRMSALSSLRFLLFGHALYEKALNPYIGMTGKGLFFQVEETFLQQSLTQQLKTVDQWLADFVLRKLSSTADLAPIPVLGYPGWSKANASSDYYDNRWYFRPL